MKKLLALLLSLILLLSVAAVADTAESDPYFGRYDEPVTIRLVVNGTDSEDGSWTWEDNEWTREWLERFNIKIEVMWNANTDEAYNTKFAMAMLTGDLPDLLVLNQKQFRELQTAGKLADLTEYYDNNVYPYLKEKVLEAQPESAQQAGFVDGRRYALTTSGFGTVSRSVIIRHDYREAVGAELPTTMEELIQLGKTFVDEGLTKYAFVLTDKVTGSGYTDMQAVCNAFGAYPGLWIEGEDGRLVYSPTTEAMHTALDVYKELFDEGYIQPTFATEVSDNVTAYIKNGEVGIVCCDFWVLTWPLPITDEDGNVIDWDVISVPASETNDDFHVQGTGSAASITYYCVNAECEHPEAVLRLFNHTCSVNTDPDLEETARFHTVVKEDGTEISVHMHNPSVRYWSVPNVNTLTGWAVKEALDGNTQYLAEQPHYQQQYDNVTAYLAAKEAGDKETMKGKWGMYKLFGGEGSVFYNFYTLFHNNTFIFDALTEKSEDYDRLWGALTQYENTFYVNYICGTEETTFEEFVQEWYTMGGQLLTDQVNAGR